MPSMHPYLRLHLHLRPAGQEAGRARLAERSEQDRLRLSPMLRRVLGKALIDLFCPYGEPRCQPQGGKPVAPQTLCALAEACPYGVLYAASQSGRPPFVLAVITDDERVGRAGHLLLALTLVGPACQAYGWALMAIARGLRLGLGKSRERWEIAAVERLRPDGSCEPLCAEALSAMPSTLVPDHLDLDTEPIRKPQQVVIVLHSPTRLLRGGRLVRSGQELGFEVLIARILDRFRGLFGDRASEVLRPENRARMEDEAARVPLVRDETRWIDVPDYSARSRSALLMGGLMGRLVYGEGAARFLPILRAGEILHVGKNPTAGCGRMEVEHEGPTSKSRRRY